MLLSIFLLSFFFFFFFFFFRVERGDRLWSLWMMGDPLVTPGGAVGQDENAMGPVCLCVELEIAKTRCVASPWPETPSLRLGLWWPAFPAVQGTMIQAVLVTATFQACYPRPNLILLVPVGVCVMDTGTWVQVGPDQTPNIPAPQLPHGARRRTLDGMSHLGPPQAEVGRSLWQDVAP